MPIREIRGSEAAIPKIRHPISALARSSVPPFLDREDFAFEFCGEFFLGGEVEAVFGRKSCCWLS